ncbi:MAG TPA: FAD-binding protein [Polyangiaceae bacterium]|nr:FAD-binding protein [Polyangiaceae bacterium]
MIARRHFVAGLGAAVVLGFSPTKRTWISSAEAASSPFDHVPHLDGVLLTDPTSLAADAVDVGNIVHNTPMAVLRPGSVEDIAKMIRFSRRLGIKVAARGQGHTTMGQSQVLGGLVIEMSTLNKIHSFSAQGADVDAGVQWKDLLQTTIPQGLVPPVLTGFTALSIGGTLSVGGISSTNGLGAQVDHARELEVVTGTGEIKRCSAFHNSDLFEAALAGLGQCGIITRATVDLMPAPSMARVFAINYTDGAQFFADLRILLDRGEFNDVFNLGGPNPSGGFVYQLNAVKFFEPSSPPDGNQLLRGLSVSPSAASFQDAPYEAYVLRVDAVIDIFKQLGLWDGVLHPWFDAFLPNRTVEPYVTEVTASLTPDDVGQTGFLLLFPQKRSRLTRKFFRVPESDDWVFLFDILTAANVPGPNPAFQAQMLARNRTLFDKARRLGGTRYPIGSIEFSKLDWVLQYGESFPEFAALKARFDPDNILTPGPGIF